MSGSAVYGYNREAVRVKVKKCEKNVPPETRKFSVDPQITSLEVLYSILAKAFDLKTDFGISCKAPDPNGQENYLVVLSDWDLDAAFLRAHNMSIATKSEPCLYLRVDIKPFSETIEWDGSGNVGGISRELASLQQSIGAGQKYVQNRLPGLIMNHMEKTFSLVQRALNLTEDPLMTQTLRPPLSDAEFRTFCDSVGQIVEPEQLRKVIYLGGIEPSLRRVIWKHILNVYPDGMTGRERMDYMKKKSGEYFKLRDVWRTAVQQGNIAGELAYVTSMVRKDVLRTDRLHPFYAGSDDNQNIASLFNVLTTYALNHPAVSYCQGMSDIASPLLVTMADEAQAYICFCAVMTRMSCNFMLDGIAMTLKFNHLSEALQYYDSDFFAYLKLHQADDLLFCYRWLLLEMKREFAFEDSLRMLEVLWSSLPAMAPKEELALFEKEYTALPPEDAQPKSPSKVILRTPRENPYTKVCALRRQSSALSLCSSTNPISIRGAPAKLDATKRLNLSLDENISRDKLYSNKVIMKEHQSLDETKNALVKQCRVFRSVGDDDIQEDNHHGMVEGDTADGDGDSDNVFHSPQHVETGKNPFLDSSPESTTPLEPIEVSTPSVSSSLTNNADTVKEDSTTKDNTVLANEPQTASSHTVVIDSNVRKSPVSRTKSLFSAGTGSLIARQLTSQRNNISTTGGGHFKDLKDKLAASKKGIFASRNQSDVDANSTQPGEDGTKPRLVKNFNEFLNFAAMNRSRISDRLITKRLASSLDSTGSNTTLTTGSSITMDDDSTETIEYDELKPKPLIKLTKSSFEDSDSSSIGVADSTAAISRSSDNSSFIVDDSSVSVSPTQPLHGPDTAQNDEEEKGQGGSSPDDSQEYFPMTTSMTRELRLELENLDRHVFGTDFHNQQRFYTLSGCIELDTPPESGESITSFAQTPQINYRKLDQNGSIDAMEIQSIDNISYLKEIENADVVRYRQKSKQVNDIDADTSKRISTSSTNADVFVWENPLHQCESPLSTGGELSQVRAPTTVIEQTATTPDEHPELEYDGEIIVETMGKKSITPIRLVRRVGDQSNSNSNRNSMVLPDSDSDDLPERSLAVNFKFHPNNPFYDANSIDPIELTDNLALEPSLNIPASSNMTCSSNSFEEATEASKVDLVIQQPSVNIASNIAVPECLGTLKVAGVLPPPHEFGGGNPFLMFLCLTILLQHRDYVMKSGMDYNEMAMHFDKMVRKHNVVRVLNQARQMFAEYRRLYHQQQQQRNSAGSASMSSSMYGRLGTTSATHGNSASHPRRNTTSGVMFTA
ncbi:uncharacterized protein LOC131430959 [Malaya genurostris]|uniref:uncharacterized protein LOC131430959 n=1 Tax=Malaya genurostris TaxID=325434 RepID=UPI0026F3DC33|nr:uncharacterized protein LOC131430959 [Malaya genurostris]XP_058452262.1 uncharacterized protein LOC131430959 [Malaya genurostris]XP_058452264.1 uncharacterized protein LOC131430959 [Malaya genurostris]XP_058452265.1 uncharacterized protein LOC131430959 [Malaya genurostris]XP_058452266.1 uncharacterized protein LOC131430959 [Malaya genurostris]XP_058452267.1 uncharacterized protein LOC131430959 [Malaya genurostris]XP_058452268.1 uncharacterized protein LOC131430959 [Malaya genurostris]